MKFNSPYEIEFPEPYEVEHNCFGYTYTKKDMDIFVELCNFVPYISSEITSYDGYEKKTKIKIAGFDSNGNHLPEVIVLNDEFDKMLWIRENWGFNCNIVKR